MRNAGEIKSLTITGLIVRAARSNLARWALIFFSVMAVATGAWMARASVKKAHETLVADKLQAILRTGAAALTLWLDTRRAAAFTAARDPVVIKNALALAARPGEERALAALGDRLSVFLAEYGFRGFLILSPDGVNVGAGHGAPIGEATLPPCCDAVDSLLAGSAVVSRPFRSMGRPTPGRAPCTGPPEMIAAAPVRDENGAVAAALVFLIPPEEGFGRILESGRPGESGETYAFDARAVMLSPSRFAGDLARSGLLIEDREEEAGTGRTLLNVAVRNPGRFVKKGFRPPPMGERPLTRMAQSALTGANGVNVRGYTDYRGVEVVGAWTWLSEYGLGVATEMNAAEAFAPLRLMDSIIGMSFAFVVVVGIAFLLVTWVLAREQLPGARFGRYTVEQKIGKGKKGVVYKARHRLLRRPTALKVLLPGRSRKAAVARFEREVMLTAGLSHPNTVRIYDYGRTPQGVFYYAVEYIEGLTLFDLVQRFGPQPEARIAHILMQVCGSLEEAHAAGLVHRDIKPENLFLTRRAREFDVIKVVDFGSLKLSRPGPGPDADLDATDTGAPPGTPLYTSPEGILTPDDVDGGSDLFSVGLVGFFLLTGTDAFQADTPEEVYEKILNQDPPSMSGVLGRPVANQLNRVIRWCLEKDRQRRPASAAVLAEAFIACRDMGGWSENDAREWWERFMEAPRGRDAA